MKAVIFITLISISFITGLSGCGEENTANPNQGILPPEWDKPEHCVANFTQDFDMFDDFGDKIQIKVSDSGEGIPKEIQEKIFEKHFTTKGDKGGTGIGLDVCIKLLERIDASIEVDNSAFNTTFLIHIAKKM